MQRYPSSASIATRLFIITRKGVVMKKPEKSAKKSGEIADEKLDKVSGGALASTLTTVTGGLNATLDQTAYKIPPKRILTPEGGRDKEDKRIARSNSARKTIASRVRYKLARSGN